MALMDLLGSPQRTYPVIHITGTNGKTSTARMIEALLRAHGLRTGLFTSPHLDSPRERICFDGEPIDPERFVTSFIDIEPYVALVDANSLRDGGEPLSFFEVMVGLFFAACADAPIDVAIVEVGMGGTWDATNVGDGVVAVITPIDVDHIEYLGDNPAQIAVEKSGIIKSDATAVFAPQRPEVSVILEERCASVNATCVAAGSDFGVLERSLAVGGQLLTLQGLRAVYDDIFLPVFGGHQAGNAAVALAAVESFLGTEPLDVDVVRDGFAMVSSPGRLEVIRRGPTVVVDAAHNPHGAQSLAEAVHDSFDFDHVVAVVAMLAGKDAHGFFVALDGFADVVVITENSSPRCLDRSELVTIAANVMGSDRVLSSNSLPDALSTAIDVADTATGRAGIVVTGSVVTVADAKRLAGRA